jgi:hypothetical protein
MPDQEKDRNKTPSKGEGYVRDGYVPPAPPIASNKNKEEKGYVPPPPPPKNGVGKKK